MSYSENEIEKIYQQLLESSRNILPGTTAGGTVGASVFVALRKPYNGQASLTGITLQDCPPGECLALSDGINWYVVSTGAIASRETILRFKRSRSTEEVLPKDKMAILYTSLSTGETNECTCPNFSYTDGKCQEVCSKSEYSTLKDCQSQSVVWSVYMSVGKSHWQRYKFRNDYRNYYLYPDAAREVTYDLYPNNFSNQVGSASVMFDDYPLSMTPFPGTRIPGRDASFLYDLAGVEPPFSMSASLTGRLKWEGEKDLDAVKNSGLNFDIDEKKKDPYLAYKKKGYIQVYGSNYIIFQGYPNREFPTGTYYGQYTSYVQLAGDAGFLGIVAMVEPKNVEKSVDYFRTALGSRFDGESIQLDYVLDRNRKVVKDYNTPPPPPPYEPPSGGKLYFLLGGDRRLPLKLPFTLNEFDDCLAHLSVVNQKKIITIKHGYETGKGFCKVTTLEVNKKNEIKKNTTSRPGPVPPVSTEWRNHLVYSFLETETRSEEKMKCSYSYWQSQTDNIASKLKSYPWNGEKALLYEFAPNSDFRTNILLKNFKVDYNITSAVWKSTEKKCRVNREKATAKIAILRLLTHEEKTTTYSMYAINILAFAIYNSR